MAERAGQLGGLRSAWRCRILVVECAVGQGGRSARWLIQSPLLWLRDSELPQCLSSNPWGCSICSQGEWG